VRKTRSEKKKEKRERRQQEREKRISEEENAEFELLISKIKIIPEEQYWVDYWSAKKK
jgi:predicted nucleic acid-binding protein